MVFNARVVQILIASPSDTAGERHFVRQSIEDWNALHGENGLIFLPLLWERDATPEMSDRAQGVINRQLVDRCDMLIGLFWTRLGTPTEEGDSGTAEEIERCIAQGKPVAIYFSDVPIVVGSVDLEEYGRLQDFRTDLEGRGLIDTYARIEDLLPKVHALLTRHARDTFQVDAPEAPESKEATSTQLLARVETEREMSGFAKNGKPRYRTRRTLILENRGTTTAQNVQFKFEAPGATYETLPHVHGADEPASHFAPGTDLTYPLSVHTGTVAQANLILTWREGEEDRQSVQTIRLF